MVAALEANRGNGEVAGEARAARAEGRRRLGALMTPPRGSSCSIVAVAGRRVDAVDTQTTRFSYENADSVRAALARALENAAVMLVVASAACGSDLLALDVASVLGIRTRIILPFAPDVFRETSVVDRPHPAYWGRLYDRLIARGPHVLNRDRNDPGAYVAANQAIIAEALLAAGNEAPPVGHRQGRALDASSKSVALAERNVLAICQKPVWDPAPLFFDRD